MLLSLGGCVQGGANESFESWGPLLWPIEIHALVMGSGLQWILADVEYLSLTWVIGLFVMVDLSDLADVEIGIITKLEKSINLDILRAC